MGTTRSRHGPFFAVSAMLTWLGSRQLLGTWMASAPPGFTASTTRGKSSWWSSSHWKVALE